MKIINWLKENYILVTIFFIGAVMRIYKVDYQSLWIDEIHTINETNPDYSFAEMSAELRRLEPHPRLYFILVHFVFKIFGYSSFVLRMFSAVVGIAGIAAIYHLGKELYNKKVGLYAAILLAINCFHLAYSQEGRMYALFFLCTTLSFYGLIRLIKEQNARAITLYVITTVLMLYCHLFSLFALCAQIIILLFFILNSESSIRRNLFFQSLIAGAGILVLYIPNIIMLKWVTEVKSSWIPLPPMDVYSSLFFDFFGHTELVKLFVGIPIITYFIFLFREKGEGDKVNGIIKNKMVFSFIILFTWLFVTLLLPLIRSYMSTPMMINRYFINVLPAIIVIISIGLYCVNHRIIRLSFLALIITFSMTDLLLVENYYRRFTKAQFKDLSKCLIENNKKNETLVSNVGWYFPFYLKDLKEKPKILEISLDTYVEKIMADQGRELKKPFWYAELSTMPISRKSETIKYLESNFIADTVCKFFKAYLVHYTLISGESDEINIDNVKILKDRDTENYKYYVDLFEYNNETLIANGYAFFGDQNSQDTYMEVVVAKGGKVWKIRTDKIKREDVTSFFNSKFDLGNSGFGTKFTTEKLPKGIYELGILLKNKKANREGLILTQKYFEVK